MYLLSSFDFCISSARSRCYVWIVVACLLLFVGGNVCCLSLEKFVAVVHVVFPVVVML